MVIEQYQHEFIEFAIACGVLSFGEFTLKSGRQSPYFFNAGKFDTGMALAKVGKYYAAAIQANSDRISYDVIFGPAYKGIPLAASTVISLATSESQRDVPYCFNRKEKKDHGEGGTIVGAPLKGRVLIIDDVTTAGTAIRESVDIINNVGASLAGVIVSIDRQEKGKYSDKSAIQEIEGEYGVPVIAVVTLDTIVEYLKEKGDEYTSMLKSMEEYRKQYGAIYE
ncbi:orotate phosphoribosyltransferase [Coemansia sp. RSA 1813]|nr:orotate phosphoribosyltransferase [Coemansia sp. RSA 1646]KAJ1768835.1 orotate phosphoribosyltransferase [Coemansia sp. RSA 1843]KAJ2086928.1 orotate phosphoribosyltransferase [Coemansia sp. RSA 986]KAJ2211628.1 orotate phosphoribosyltransferase [Coemansia sp. RSA 487]KAJ2565172.1 orotate phosphoribosyltransferase [Coemansia sp. RSA 1813]